MERNLDNRIEVITPITDPTIQQELDTILDSLMKDTHSSFHLESESYNLPLEQTEGPSYRAQESLYRYFSDRLTV